MIGAESLNTLLKENCNQYKNLVFMAFKVRFSCAFC